MRIPWCACLFVLSLSLSAQVPDFGTATELKAAHPEFFIPGRISTITNKGIPYYVYNGKAIRFFKDEPVYAFPELRQIALVNAENNLSKHLMKDRRERRFSASGSLQIAKEVSDNEVLYVFAVPVRNVQVLPPQSKPVTLAGDSAVKTESSKNVAQTNGTKVIDGERLLQLQDLAEQNPEDGTAQAALAEALFQSGMFDDAEKTAIRTQELIVTRDTRTLRPNEVQALFTTAEILKKCGEYGRALQGYKRILGLNYPEYRAAALNAISQINLKQLEKSH